MTEPSASPRRSSPTFADPLQVRFESFLADQRRVRAARKAQEAKAHRRIAEWQAAQQKEADDPSKGDQRDVDPREKRAVVVASPSQPLKPAREELIHTDDGPKLVRPHEAAAVRAELERRTRHDPWKHDQERARFEFAERAGEPYEPRYFDIREADISGQSRTDADNLDGSALPDLGFLLGPW